QKWPRHGHGRVHAHALELAKQFFTEFGGGAPAAAGETGEKQLDSLQSIGESSGYESFKWRPADEESEATDTTLATTASEADLEHNTSSISSGGMGATQGRRETWRISHNNRNELILTDLDFSEDLFAQGTVSLGPFLNAIWGKLQTFT
ncbi:hypothetical protein KR018_009742, partial [Drosophila ironensis]